MLRNASLTYSVKDTTNSQGVVRLPLSVQTDAGSTSGGPPRLVDAQGPSPDRQFEAEEQNQLQRASKSTHKRRICLRVLGVNFRKTDNNNLSGHVLFRWEKRRHHSASSGGVPFKNDRLHRHLCCNRFHYVVNLDFSKYNTPRIGIRRRTDLNLE